MKVLQICLEIWVLLRYTALKGKEISWHFLKSPQIQNDKEKTQGPLIKRIFFKNFIIYIHKIKPVCISKVNPLHTSDQLTQYSQIILKQIYQI